jgi:tRNA threonylcarbamoyladenosine biosynthesis protein TsaB
MIVLGFDTATHATVVGLRLADGTTLSARDDPPADEHPGHATRLLAIAARLLADGDARWSDVARVAVGVGPGRFTGLRVGVATARGLAQSLAIELVGISTLRALALGSTRALLAERADAAGTIAVIDARRGEAFAAAYPPAGASEIAFSRALAAGELAQLVAELRARGVGERVEWRAVGDGAIRYACELRAAGASVPSSDSALHLLDAAALCELGAEAEPAETLASVLPDYRRDPDATLARARAHTARAGAVGPAAGGAAEALARETAT